MSVLIVPTLSFLTVGFFAMCAIGVLQYYFRRK